MSNDEKDLARVDEQPLSGSAELPQRPTGEAPSTAPEKADDDFEDYDIFASEGCQRCGGEGFIVVCIDDLCRGCGECMHGDGEIACPDCGGI